MLGRSALLAATNKGGLAWSNYLMAIHPITGGVQDGFLNSKRNAFDGSYVTTTISQQGYYVLFTPPTPISFTTSLQVAGMEPALDKATLNNTTTLSADSNGVVTFSGPGSLETLTMFDNRSGSYWEISVSAILIDGNILVEDL